MLAQVDGRTGSSWDGATIAWVLEGQPAVRVLGVRAAVGRLDVATS